jgi:hypothetical protein
LVSLGCHPAQQREVTVKLFQTHSIRRGDASCGRQPQKFA